MHKIVFLDRDGTICEDFGQHAKPADIKIYPGAAEGIALLKTAGFKTIIVTNQSKIARGFSNSEEVNQANNICLDQLIAENKLATIDLVRFCPHLAVDNCDCRKPKTGMVVAKNFPYSFNPTECWMIGDKYLDLEFGINLGIPCKQCLLLLTGHGEEELENTKNKLGKDLKFFPGLIAACNYILEEE